MSADIWMVRARRALEAAAILADVNHAERACSSAYYAIFYAARASLYDAGQPERALGKTHSGTIAAFNEFLVRSGRITPEIGRLFQQEFNRRLLADYRAEGVADDEAIDAIASANTFVAAVAALIET